jgi:arsenate reductase
MAEVGIDISSHRAKPLSAIPAERIARVVTLCAEELCPVFPSEIERLHWPLPDPAAARGSDSERLERFRGVRDQIGQRVRELFTG